MLINIFIVERVALRNISSHANARNGPVCHVQDIKYKVFVPAYQITGSRRTFVELRRPWSDSVDVQHVGHLCSNVL